MVVRHLAFRSPAATSASTTRPGTTPILPTPVVGVLGVIDDVKRRIPTGLGTEPGETLILLGDTRDEFDGSIWAQVTGDHLGGLPPKVDLEREKLLAEVLSAASRDGLVSAAHDLSEGGLMQAVVEAALTGETGCRIIVPEASRLPLSRCSRSRQAGSWWRCREPRRAGSRPCVRLADCPPPASVSSTEDRRGRGCRRGAGLVHGQPGGPAQHVGGRASRVVRVSAQTRERHPLYVWAWSLIRLDFVGIAFGALFFCLSLTPSLLPRDWLFQGLIGGVNAAIGYGIGVFGLEAVPPLRDTQAHLVAAAEAGAVRDQGCNGGAGRWRRPC